MAAKYDFKNIALMWRLAKGCRRICIGTITPPKGDNPLNFEYNKEGVEEAKKQDPTFNGYPGIPLDKKDITAQQITEVFFGRLIDNSRKDSADFYNFWLVDKSRIGDRLYLLAQTQGLSFSDMFEFVPQYYCTHTCSFISDIAGLSKSKFDLGKLEIGAELSFAPEQENEYDKDAVSISYQGEKIGYIKKGHNTVFLRENPMEIRVTVWNLTNLPGFEKLYVRIDIKK
jgi:hypothetical protein